MKTLLAILSVLALVSCKKTGTSNLTVIPKTEVTYLALGDSYTAGEAVEREESFPYVLVSKLRADGIKAVEPDVIAFTGWTTTDLIRGITEVRLDDQYDVVTILIGVNNQYRGLSPEAYRNDFREILNTAIEKSKGGRRGVFVLSIPDWTVTPFGKINHKADPAAVDRFNAVNREESLLASVHYIDITEISRLADTDPGMTTFDDLHPSAKMYVEWVKKLYPQVKKEMP